MTVLIILQGGPLDGEEQLVSNIPTYTDATLLFYLQHFQTFAPDGVTVVDMGLRCRYSVSGPGPAPVAGDLWDSSYYLGFVDEQAYVAPPPDLPTPGPTPPINAASISMAGSSSLAVSGSASLPGVLMLPQAQLEVDGEVERVAAGTVSMSASTRMTVSYRLNPGVIAMRASTSMTINVVIPPATKGFGGGAFGQGTFG